MSTLIKFESLLKKNKRNLRDALLILDNQRNKKGGNGSFQWKTYPNGDEIFNILNPLYLNEIEDFSEIMSHEYILVRDGFYPLLDFFYRFSRPGKGETILLIHEKLKFAIPESWKNNILLYNIQKNFNHEEMKSSPQSLYLCALSCDSEIRHSTFSDKINKIKKYYGKKLENINLHFAILLREDPYYRYSKELLHSSFKFTKNICREFGIDQEICTWEDIKGLNDFHNSCYYYMAENFFSHAYSYIDHFFLSRRCAPFDSKFDQKGEGEIIIDDLSNYKIHLKEFSFYQNDFWEKVMRTANSLGIGGSLFYSEFYPYSWQLADEYLFEEKKSSSR